MRAYVAGDFNCSREAPPDNLKICDIFKHVALSLPASLAALANEFHTMMSDCTDCDLRKASNC